MSGASVGKFTNESNWQIDQATKHIWRQVDVNLLIDFFFVNITFSYEHILGSVKDKTLLDKDEEDISFLSAHCSGLTMGLLPWRRPTQRRITTAL